MTDTLSPLDESHRWTVGDWLHEPSKQVSWACFHRVFDMVIARARDDDDQLYALCRMGDLPMGQLAKKAVSLLGFLMGVFGPESWLAALQHATVLNGAARAAEQPTDLATIHRLEVVQMARCCIYDEPEKARELAVGSDTPPHAHLVAAVILIEYMSPDGPGQIESITRLRDDIARRESGKEGDTDDKPE